MYAIAEKRADVLEVHIELDGAAVALEVRPPKTAIGHAVGIPGAELEKQRLSPKLT